MKRLSLKKFAQQKQPSKITTAQLLGKVLGNCHDQPSPAADPNSEDPGPDIDF